MANVAVMGAGYVGLVSAACLAQMGHSVAVVENDPKRLEPLLEGRSPFFEPGLDALIALTIEAGSLRPTGDIAQAIDGAGLVLVCVGTPILPDGQSDLRQVIGACGMIAAHAPRVPVAMRSTLPLGATQHLVEWLHRDSADTIVTNPEFLRQGTAIADFMEPTRVVVGTSTGEATPTSELLRQLYAGVGAPFLVTDFNSAEMIKNVANAFLATKLSFINEVADLCEAYGADVEEVIKGIGLDPRIGASYLRPGIAFGGSCLPKELANIVSLGATKGLDIPLLRGAAETNDSRPVRIADRLTTLLGDLDGFRVALLGLAFKPGTDDLRYSPAVALATAIAARGATVVAHDPAVPLNARIDIAGLERAGSPAEAIDGADLVVIATDWPVYADLDWTSLTRVVRRAIIFDGRNMLDASSMREAGWQLIRIGQRSSPPA